MRAVFENFAEGLKTRFSFKTESILTVLEGEVDGVEVTAAVEAGLVDMEKNFVGSWETETLRQA